MTANQTSLQTPAGARRSAAAALPWRTAGLVLAICAIVLALGGRGTALVVTDVLLMALFASSLNLIISYGGMVSFGHAAYFGLGAYGFGLAVAKLGVPPLAALLCGPALAALGGLVFGALCVRLNTIYLAMLTLACAQITYTVLFQWESVTGGDTGISGFMAPRFGLDERVYGGIVALVVVAALLVMWRVVHSPLGITIRAVGLDADRASALGINPRREQLTVFVIAATMAGVAGTGFAAFHANVFPDYAGLNFTLEALVMVVLGGIGSFWAGVLGGGVYMLLKQYVPLVTTHWELIVGVVMAVVILAMPHGLAGALARLGAARSQGRKGNAP
jgi:branched-chain amino acid transport system permease protein